MIRRSTDRIPGEDRSGSERTFIERWSRRKAESRGDESGSEPPVTTKGVLQSPVPEPPPRELADADMPAVEALNEDSDVSSFFSPGVSEELRRLALRKVFHLPRFNVRDGLDDYDDDFTSFVALGETLTADMRHRLAVEARRSSESARSDAVSGADEPNSEPELSDEFAAPATQTQETAQSQRSAEGSGKDDGASEAAG